MPFKRGDIVKFGFGSPSYDKRGRKFYTAKNYVCIIKHISHSSYLGYFVCGDNISSNQDVSRFNLEEDAELIDHHEI